MHWPEKESVEQKINCIANLLQFWNPITTSASCSMFQIYVGI